MSAHSHQSSTEIEAIVNIDIAGFTARETFGEYAENKIVMRVSHQGFLDHHIIGCRELARASNTATPVSMRTLVFNQPRERYLSTGRKLMTLPHDSILELQLFAQTINSSEQDCVKTEGAFRHILLRNHHVDTTTAMNATREYKNVRFICECIEGTYRPGSRVETVDGIKATAKFIGVRIVSVNHRVVFAEMKLYRTLHVVGLDSQARSRLGSAIYAHQEYHENVRVAVPKLQHYYSLQYKIAEGLSLPASTYMMHMMASETLPIAPGVVKKMFACALAEHPEFGDVPTNTGSGLDTPTALWLARCNMYLQKDVIDLKASPQAPANGPSFTDCLRVAMAVLTAYPNAVPYLLDMEIDTSGKQKGNADMFAHVYDSELPDTGEKYNANLSSVNSVERFAQAVMESYGTDCEDFAIFSHWLKNNIQTQFIDSADPVLRTLAQIYELFIACVMHMFCTGDDTQIEEDDGVYHFTLYMIPRQYMSECWDRGDGAINIFKKRTAHLRSWEHDYKQHLGVFIVEGTNTVDSAQFDIGEANRQLRMNNTQRACLGIRNITSVETQKRLNVYHSFVYAKPTQLSGFFRWALAMFCTETDRENIIDLCFFNKFKQKGVRVEALADMSSDVRLQQAFRYEKTLQDLCTQLLEIYRPPYRSLCDTAETDEPELSGLILASSPLLRKLASNPGPKSLEDRRRNVRVHIQHLDFSDKHPYRAQQIITGLEELATGMNATSLQIHSKVLGATWCSPADMSETNSTTKHRVVKLFIIYYY